MRANAKGGDACLPLGNETNPSQADRQDVRDAFSFGKVLPFSRLGFAHTPFGNETKSSMGKKQPSIRHIETCSTSHSSVYIFEKMGVHFLPLG